jgi:5-(carboxyamino)imidazole ribonucleotide mutase
MATKKPTTKTAGAAKVAVLMGSKNDYDVMSATVDVLTEFGVGYEARVLSAHRTPDVVLEYAAKAAGRGLKVFIAGAGGAAHLAGVIAAKTTLPVLAVPIASTSLNGLDALLAMVQMPKGIPVGTLAVGKAGAANAALLAVAILALEDKALADKLTKWRAEQAAKVLAQKLP